MIAAQQTFLSGHISLPDVLYNSLICWTSSRNSTRSTVLFAKFFETFVRSVASRQAKNYSKGRGKTSGGNRLGHHISLPGTWYANADNIHSGRFSIGWKSGRSVGRVGLGENRTEAACSSQASQALHSQETADSKRILYEAAHSAYSSLVNRPSLAADLTDAM